MAKEPKEMAGDELREYLELKLLGCVVGIGRSEPEEVLMDILDDLFGLRYRIDFDSPGENRVYRIEKETELK